MATFQSNPFPYQPDAWIGRTIGDGDRYRLEQRLGSGGMGDVFLATDTRLGKPVALKLLKESLAIAEDLDLKARFERECSICAALKSQHIVQVSDYGLTSEGYPFYVMEYLQGQTLGELLVSQSRLSVTHTCKIIMQVCAGLQLAHEGVVIWNRETNTSERIKVVHRDLKPANIFLVPTALGELAKIIDFGIAKIHSLQAEYTNVTGFFLGTCHYAPPEQFDVQGEINEQSDIYSLGVILYEMLTGTDPFGFGYPNRKMTNSTWLAAHATKPPIPLRSQPHCESIPPELEAIVLRCLEKSPADRFASVAELSDALQSAMVETPTLKRASASSTDATLVYDGTVKRTSSSSSSPVVPPTTPPSPYRRFSWIAVSGGAAVAIALGIYIVPRWFTLPMFTGSNLASILASKSELALVDTLSGNSGSVLSALLSPDGRTVVSISDKQDDSGQFYGIQVWDVQSKQVLRTLNAHRGIVESLSLNADGTILASGSADRTIKLWDMATGNLIRTLEGHTAPIWSVAVSRDGQTVLSGGEDGTVRIWNLQTNRNYTLSEHVGTVYSVAFSPDEKTIVSSGEDKTIRFWDGQTGELLRTLGEPGGHRETIRAIAFSPDGQQIASASWDGTVKLWSAVTGQLLQTFEGHTDRVVAVTFVGNEAIASASLDHTIKIWKPQAEQPVQTIREHTAGVLSVSNHPNDQMLISSSSDTTIRIWR